MTRKNPHAVALGRKGGKVRAASLTPEQLSAIGRKGGRARGASLTPEQRSAIGRKIGRKGGKARAARLTPEQRRAIASKGGEAARARRRGASPRGALHAPASLERVGPCVHGRPFGAPCDDCRVLERELFGAVVVASPALHAPASDDAPESLERAAPRRRHSWKGGDVCARCGLRKITGEPGHVAYERPGASASAPYLESAGDCAPALHARASLEREALDAAPRDERATP